LLSFDAGGLQNDCNGHCNIQEKFILDDKIIAVLQDERSQNDSKSRRKACLTARKRPLSADLPACTKVKQHNYLLSQFHCVASN
jgi:hypothetical protein